MPKRQRSEHTQWSLVAYQFWAPGRKRARGPILFSAIPLAPPEARKALANSAIKFRTATSLDCGDLLDTYAQVEKFVLDWRVNNLLAATAALQKRVDRQARAKKKQR